MLPIKRHYKQFQLGLGIGTKNTRETSFWRLRNCEVVAAASSLSLPILIFTGLLRRPYRDSEKEASNNKIKRNELELFRVN